MAAQLAVAIQVNGEWQRGALIQEQGPLFCRWHTTLSELTEQAIADFADQDVAEVAQRGGYEPQQSACDLPGASEHHQDATHCPAANP